MAADRRVKKKNTKHTHTKKKMVSDFGYDKNVLGSSKEHILGTAGK